MALRNLSRLRNPQASRLTRWILALTDSASAFRRPAEHRVDDPLEVVPDHPRLLAHRLEPAGRAHPSHAFHPFFAQVSLR